MACDCCEKHRAENILLLDALDKARGELAFERQRQEVVDENFQELYRENNDLKGELSRLRERAERPPTAEEFRLRGENERLRDALAAATGKPVQGPAGVHCPLKVTHCEPMRLVEASPSLAGVLKALPSGGSVTFTRGIA